MLTNSVYKKGSKLFLFTLMLIASLYLVGCDKAKETMDDAAKKVEETTNKAGDAVSETVDKAGDMAKDAAEKVGETTDKLVDSTKSVLGDAAKKVEDAVTSKAFTGVWVGKLDSRLTTLTITGEEANKIDGKIVINYRDPLKQDVKGTYNPETKTLTMEDQLHSRYKGKYSGKISEDGKTYSGTFTTLVDKKSYNFNLVKK
ncbi:MAG: YtxH domain-containing protein [Ignavibacteriae bacterium]|nr:YtxH domain-containing protein [Ignavibacteriota bacterium]